MISQYESTQAILAGLDLLDRQQVAEKCRLFKSMNPHGPVPSDRHSTKEGQNVIIRDCYGTVLKFYQS